MADQAPVVDARGLHRRYEAGGVTVNALRGVDLPAVSILYFLVVLIRVLLQAWRRFKTTKRNKSPRK